ncbi:MAG: hypothetical protein Q4E64_10065 [Phascolarctobacterium sp.]|uniref:tetratricopeptide repeat protein n=1 Tax=Phascolarctobacterium sp. TaxID=2049039 RepID=UPI0026DCD3A1|nr:hypothetical protein [Phascolarctobacterium sp.]MDO4922151.1 hypothetical protein [Phascolarctobacterium sp.]
MSRETEKIFKELHAFLEQKGLENMSEEETERAIDEFMQMHNVAPRVPLTEATAKTADDYFELASESESKQKILKYLKEAIKLDPNHIDALSSLAMFTYKNHWDLLNKLQEVVERGKKVMQQKGWDDQKYIGDYWLITETRPYMRAREDYMNILFGCGMLRKAAAECEEMLRLCEGDNLGVRHKLMHIFAILEEKDKALALHKKFAERNETQMLLPLSILMFKLGETDLAAEYLKRLASRNKDTKKFIKLALQDGGVQELIDRFYDEDELSQGYRPFTMDEFIIEINEYPDLFSISAGYFSWAHEELKPKRQAKPTKSTKPTRNGLTIVK